MSSTVAIRKFGAHAERGGRDSQFITGDYQKSEIRSQQKPADTGIDSVIFHQRLHFHSETAELLVVGLILVCPLGGLVVPLTSRLLIT